MFYESFKHIFNINNVDETQTMKLITNAILRTSYASFMIMVDFIIFKLEPNAFKQKVTTTTPAIPSC